MKKFLSVVLSLALTLSLLSGCGSQKENSAYTKYSDVYFNLFNTVISVVSYQKTQQDFDEMSQYIQDRYDQLNKMYDIYNSYDGLNNIKTINDNAGIAPVKVSSEIIDLLEFSKQWYEKSNGKVNIALGSVLRVWHDVRQEYEDALESGDDEKLGNVKIPSLDLLREKAEHTDINAIEIDRENMTVYISDPLVSIDVGAVAKGYATEIICDELSEKYDNFAISAGGNVKTHGTPKDGRKRWSVGIQNPAVDENFEMLGGNMDMAYFNTDMSLVCSGGYQRYFVIDGVRYHHLIDPVTLFPEEIYQGVAIICEDSGMADALSTAAFLSAPSDALALIDSVEGAECILVENDGTVLMSEGAKAYLASCGVDAQTK